VSSKRPTGIDPFLQLPYGKIFEGAFLYESFCEASFALSDRNQTCTACLACAGTLFHYENATDELAIGEWLVTSRYLKTCVMSGTSRGKNNATPGYLKERGLINLSGAACSGKKDNHLQNTLSHAK
jgi:hypothetical protein